MRSANEEITLRTTTKNNAYTMQSHLYFSLSVVPDLDTVFLVPQPGSKKGKEEEEMTKSIPETIQLFLGKQSKREIPPN